MVRKMIEKNEDGYSAEYFFQKALKSEDPAQRKWANDYRRKVMGCSIFKNRVCVLDLVRNIVNVVIVKDMM